MTDYPRYPLADMTALAFERVYDPLKARFPGIRASIAGSIRRKRPLVKDIDLVVVASAGVRGFVRALLSTVTMDGMDNLQGTLGGGRIIPGSVPLQAWICTADSWGATLLQVTGPVGFNVWLRETAKARGMLLSNEGLFYRYSMKPVFRAPSEGEIINYILGKRYIEPEYRDWHAGKGEQ
jgi:DNA polymerase (family X)